MNRKVVGTGITGHLESIRRSIFEEIKISILASNWLDAIILNL